MLEAIINLEKQYLSYFNLQTFNEKHKTDCLQYNLEKQQTDEMKTN